MSGVTYIGVKMVRAEPMTRAAYNDFRGWKLPSDENGADEGFLVEYLDGGATNVDGRAGYVSWSPRAVFEKAYRPTRGMSFGLAVEAMKSGRQVARKGWNGKGMFVFLVSGSKFLVSRPPLLGIYAAGTPISYCPHIDMKTADDKVVPWLASQTDVLADDWEVVA
jgi:hypothetical protein